MHIRNIPGRKSDVSDAVWIADLLALGLIRSSFVPPAAIQDLRDLTRTRTQLVRELARHTQRLQKTLEDANIKLTEVISDILGTSGRAMLEALIAGETNPARLAALAHPRLRASRADLMMALHDARRRTRPLHRSCRPLGPRRAPGTRTRGLRRDRPTFLNRGCGIREQ
jgi:transposase